MNVSELKQALDSAPEESSVMLRTATGEMCPITALHVGAGGDAAGVVSLECGPENSDAAAEPEDDSDDLVDTLAKKSGFLKPKAKEPMAQVAEEDDAE